ncbi:MAG: PTS system mannose/fructose/sorbose family transporter subunit IID [Anaerococcus prevotii]|uniref:PTS system mannose/fructose/sorbose family transporter subunit IID n=1 Tax=Anaerococcus prevotii TaxID=33034 RepID=UPI0028FFB3C3|nr:PTS system mannose/fructose/sorbose family transporter subunit IID [Anaerococcus prevotii]MDU2558590.1 PTS system mannose/fructose/sorbose family transporter subunit IID [Anaerococcus prevotii]
MNFNKIKNQNSIITKKDLRKLGFRTLPMEHAWNYERMMHMGYAWALMPILKKLYPDDENFKEALTRHLEFYNTTPFIISFPLGISAAMEEERANNMDTFDTKSISEVKTALMGPLAGIGDSIFWGTLRIIATGIGTSLALQGNILGPILFLLTWNIPSLLCRYILSFVGFNLGTEVITQANEHGIMEKLTKAASIVGLAVAGSMTAEMVNVNIGFSLGSGEAATTIQEILDGIIPGIPTLLIFWLSWVLLKKKVSPLIIMLIMLAMGLIGAYTGILAV